MAIKNPVFGRIDAGAEAGAVRHIPHRARRPQRRRADRPARDAGAGDLENMYAAPPATTADTGRLTYDDVIMKTAVQFVVLLAAAAVSWRYVASLDLDHQSRGIAVWLVAMFAGARARPGDQLQEDDLRPPDPRLRVRSRASSSGPPASTSTPSTTASSARPSSARSRPSPACSSPYKLGLIKVNDKFRRIMGFALLGYAAIALVSLVSAFAGVGGGFGFYGVGAFGILLCLARRLGLAAVTLARQSRMPSGPSP